MDNLHKLKLTPLEHRLARTLRELDVADKHLLVAVSGGADSVALVHALARLSPMLKTNIAVVHIHHGPAERSQLLYRNRASNFVKRLARNLKLEFFSSQSEMPLNSEAELRQFRQNELAKFCRIWSGGEALIVTAHHRDDLLETHLLRMLRGTGLKGITGMLPMSRLQTDKKIRLLKPLLEVERAELVAYAKKFQLRWLNDPSNQNVEPQRNWLRKVWLPLLAKKWPGAERSMLRSFELIGAEVRENEKRRAQLVAQTSVADAALSRQKFLALSRDEKTTVLAEYLLRLGSSEFSLGQLREIVRQLDNRRGEFTFVAARNFWQVSTTQIRAVANV